MTTTPHRRAVSTAVAAGLVITVLGGCAGGSDEAATGGGGTPEPQDQGDSTNGAQEGAADGTDLTQCSDAVCEVVVREGDEIPMEGTQGLEELVVDSADDEQVALTGTGPGTMVNGSVGAPYNDGPVLFLNGIGVAVVSADTDHAVIALSSPAE